MINVLVHHEVADYPAWKAAFDAALDWRHKNGEHSARIFHTAGSVTPRPVGRGEWPTR